MYFSSLSSNLPGTQENALDTRIIRNRGTHCDEQRPPLQCSRPSERHETREPIRKQCYKRTFLRNVLAEYPGLARKTVVYPRSQLPPPRSRHRTHKCRSDRRASRRHTRLGRRAQASVCTAAALYILGSRWRWSDIPLGHIQRMPRMGLESIALSARGVCDFFSYELSNSAKDMSAAMTSPHSKSDDELSGQVYPLANSAHLPPQHTQRQTWQ